MGKKLICLCLLIFSATLLNSCDDKGNAKENLLGTWVLKPENSMDLTWESPLTISIGGIDMPTEAVALLAAKIGSDLMTEKLYSIDFKDDGNINVNHKDDNSGRLVTEVYGTYKVVNNNKLLYYPDVEKMLKGVQGIDHNKMEELKDLAKQGMPVNYVLMGQNLTDLRMYLDTNTIKEMKLLFPLLVASLLGGDIEGDTVNVIIENLPALLDMTTKIELGLNFDKKIN